MANVVAVQDRLLSKEFLWEVPDVFATGFEPFASFDVVVPEIVLITGRHAKLKETRPALDPIGNPLIAPTGELMFEIAGAMVNLKNTEQFGRFANKAELWRAGQIAEHGFRYNVGGMNAGRIFFGIEADAETKRLCPKTNGKDVKFLPVYFGEAQFTEDGQVCNRGDQPRNRDGSPYELFVKLPLSFAIARGLVLSKGGVLWALSDNVLIKQVAIAAALGLRLHWRNYGEPGRVNFLDLLLTRKDIIEMMKGFSANCGALSSDEMALLGFIAASAMGCPSGMSPSKYGVIDADGVPNPSQNMLLAAHHSPWIDTPAPGISPATDPIRAAHGQAPAFGLGGAAFPTLPNEKRVLYCGLDPRFQNDYGHRIKPDEMRLSDSLEIIVAVIANRYDVGAKKLLLNAVFDDPVVNDVETQPGLIRRFERAGRLVADYSALRRFQTSIDWERGDKGEVEKLFDPNGSTALYDYDDVMRDARRNALLDQVDSIIEKEIAIVSKRGDLDVKAAKAFLGNPYFYFKHRRKSLMWFRLVGADWQMRTGDQAQYDAEALVNRCGAPTPGYSPIAGKGIPTLLMKAALEEVFVSCVRLLPNRDRDPKPWKEMAETNPFISTLGPDAIYSLCQMFSEIAARCKEYDAKSRFLEVMIAKGAKPKKMPPSTADPEVNSEWDRIEKGTPAATVYGDRWQTMLTRARSDTGGAAYFVVQLEGIWRDTKDMVFGRPGSIWEAILGEIRNPVHRGVWDELADVYEWRVRALVTNEEVIYA